MYDVERFVGCSRSTRTLLWMSGAITDSATLSMKKSGNLSSTTICADIDPSGAAVITNQADFSSGSLAHRAGGM